MTTLGLDSFDRSGALGSLWTTYGGAFACDGDRAAESGLPGVQNLAAMTIYAGASDLYPRRVSVRVTRPATNAGTVEFGLLVAPLYNAASVPPILTWKEVGWRSSAGGQLFARARQSLPGTSSFPDVWTSAYAWPAGEVRTLRADVTYLGGPTVNVAVYVDDVLLGSFASATAVTLNAAGLSSFRGTVAAGSNPAGVPLFDLFKVEDYATGVSSEVPPAASAVAVLSGVVLEGEGLIASAVALPIRAPDETWTEGRRWRTSERRSESSHVLRFPRGSRARTTRAFSWSGLTDAELATLRTFFDTTPGPAGIGTYTTPEGAVLYFALGGAKWTVEPTGPLSRRVTIEAPEVFAT